MLTYQEWNALWSSANEYDVIPNAEGFTLYDYSTQSPDNNKY